MRLMIVSWYGPADADAGERIRLAGITSTFDDELEVSWLVVDPTYALPGSIVPPAELVVPWRTSTRDYVIATGKGRAIEADRLGRYRRLRAWVAAELDRIRPDAIWVNQPYAWPLIPRAWQSRAVLDTHNVNSARLIRLADTMPVASPKRVMATVQGVLTRRFEASYVSLAARAIAVTEEDAQDLRDRVVTDARARVVVIGNGADLDHDAETLIPGEGEAPRLLFIGSLGYSANLSGLSLLADWLEDTTLPLDITVAGSGDSTEASRICARDRRLHLIGRVEDARRTMSEHHALITPLTQGGGSRIKIHEAIATRLPVIATEVAVEGIGLISGESYLRVETPAEFAAAVLSLSGGDGALRLAEAAWRIAEGYEWTVLSSEARGVLRVALGTLP